MDENAKRSDFKDRMLPHLESLLQLSLWLTKDGRDAVSLMREAMAETYGSWDESTSDEPCDVHLRYILTRRFIQGSQQDASQLGLNSDGYNVDESLGQKDHLGSTTITARQQSWLTGESNEDVDYFVAFASLPAAFRSVMILSYLEGFTNKEIADLAGVQPLAVESLLDRGQRFLREELFAHLMGSDDLDAVADQAGATG